MMASISAKISTLDFMQQLYTFHFTDEVMAGYLVCTTNTGKHAWGNYTGDSFLSVDFKADIYKSMQNTVLDKHV